MKFINNLSISCAIVASAFSLLICNADCADSEGALAQKGRLLLSDDFIKAPADRKARRFFRGKVLAVPEHPESILYQYLTAPRKTSPRWFLEGMAVFLETWMAGISLKSS